MEVPDARFSRIVKPPSRWRRKLRKYYLHLLVVPRRYISRNTCIFERYLVLVLFLWSMLPYCTLLSPFLITPGRLQKDQHECLLFVTYWITYDIKIILIIYNTSTWSVRSPKFSMTICVDILAYELRRQCFAFIITIIL